MLVWNAGQCGDPFSVVGIFQSGAYAIQRLLSATICHKERAAKTNCILKRWSNSVVTKWYRAIRGRSLTDWYRTWEYVIVRMRRAAVQTANNNPATKSKNHYKFQL